MNEEKKMTLTEHLDELRLRILYSLLAWIACSSIAYFYTPRILSLFTAMIRTKLVFVNPTEAFMAYLKIAMLMGLFVALPFIIYEIITFVFPGLESEERKWVLRLVPFAIALFVLGVLFAYFILIPVSLRFFLSFGTRDLEAMITIGSFISFVLTITIMCGLIFQTPLTIFFLGVLGIVNSKMLSEQRKYVILFFFVVAAIATPTPDAFTQILVTVPLIVLYEIGILLVRLIERGRKKKLAKGKKDEQRQKPENNQEAETQSGSENSAQ